MKIWRSITKLGYRRIAKPLLFRLSPDKAHNLITDLSKKIQYIPLVNLLPRLWAYQNDERLRQTIYGLNFKNPIGLSAGFDKELELAPLMKAIGMGYMIGGSVTSKPCIGNDRPWYQRLPELKSLIVHAGLPSSGAAVIKRRLSRYAASRFDDFPLSVSIAKTNNCETADDELGVQDYLQTLTLLKDEPNVSIVEINISCPNAYGGEPFTTPKRLDNLLKAIDGVSVRKPIFIKMPIDLEWKDFQALLDVIVRHQIVGVTIGNLRKNREGLELPREAQPGGLSGLPTRDLCNQLIGKTYRQYGDRLTIIGVGGVFTAEDAYTKIRAGASLVAIITGLIFEGPQVVGEINEGLVALMQKDGFEHINEVIGIGA